MSNKYTLQSPSIAANAGDARDIYNLLMESPSTQASRSASRAYLKQRLERAAKLPLDMPMEAHALELWIERKSMAVGQDYSNYLEQRKAGEPRQYFTCRAHALSFLQRVSPTKLVDGAWLYGALKNWQDHRFHALIRTYLEELGDGDPAANHVVLYQRLLAENGCDMVPPLSDEHYIQGALQLALGYHAEQFLPELIGYNLGYEQLPLHLLITAFELRELDIDPYYFTLHVTIDNISTGHARKAVQTLLRCLPADGDPGAFLQRVANGYRLNELGLGTIEVIDSFDLEHELVTMLERKSLFGKYVHSDFCSIGGRTVNEWLTAPGQIENFLRTLTAKGWIKRHQKPTNSRFWRLIEGPKAQMAGVFNAFEKQLLHDWIAGDWLTTGIRNAGPASHTNRQSPRNRRTFRRYRGPDIGPRASIDQRHDRLGDLDHDIKQLERELRLLSEPLRMQRLIRLMAPDKHATAAGLFATREFAAIIQ